MESGLAQYDLTQLTALDLDPWPSLTPQIIKVYKKFHGLNFVLLKNQFCSIPIFHKGSGAISLPHDASLGGPCGPEANQPQFLKEVKDWSTNMGLKTVVIRTYQDVPWNDTIPKTLLPYHLSRLTLSSNYDESMLSSHHKRRLKKSQKMGVVVESGIKKEETPYFFKIAEQLSKNFGTFPPSNLFLQTLFQEASPVSVWTARKEDRYLGSLIGFINSKNSIYKYGFCTPEGRENGAYYSLVFEFLKQSAQLGAPTAHLGVTGLNEEGLLRFKRGWGADTIPGAWHYLLGKPGFPVWKFFPAPEWLKFFITLTPDKFLQKLSVGLY